MQNVITNTNLHLPNLDVPSYCTNHHSLHILCESSERCQYILERVLERQIDKIKQKSHKITHKTKKVHKSRGKGSIA